jgi:hypothetical protein
MPTAPAITLASRLDNFSVPVKRGKNIFYERTTDGKVVVSSVKSGEGTAWLIRSTTLAEAQEIARNMSAISNFSWQVIPGSEPTAANPRGTSHSIRVGVDPNDPAYLDAGF